jgi:hypothetical protein
MGDGLAERFWPSIKLTSVGLSPQRTSLSCSGAVGGSLQNGLKKAQVEVGRT